MTIANQQLFIVLPRQGVRAEVGGASDALLSLHSQLGVSKAAFGLAPGTVTVIDSIQENGAKLVELDSTSADNLNRSDSPVRALPLVEYPRPDPRPWLNSIMATPMSPLDPAAMRSITVTCEDAKTGAAVPDANVIAFTNFLARQGMQGKTNASGQVVLFLQSSTIERLYIYGPTGYWGGFQQNIPVASKSFKLEPVDLGYVDAVRHYYGGSRFNGDTGVTVGVIDTGSGPHSDLNLVGGRCTITGEIGNDWRDHQIHGTHVAGLVGASGGLKGVAPGVKLIAYRVFPADEGKGATNYAILKALIYAAMDNCDIVNLSLGGGPLDQIVEEAIADACNQGMLPIIAAGNDGRMAVSYPAAYNGAIAVSALGREGTFPAGSVEDADIFRPPSSASDPRTFIAAFSNVGPQISIAGAGVGVLSTLPNNKYGPLSGTSMASPVVAGAAASLLSQDAAIYGMMRNKARSDAIRNLLLQNCIRFGFGSNYEGYGMPDPQVV
jgi:subtilisin